MSGREGEAGAVAAAQPPSPSVDRASLKRAAEPNESEEPARGRPRTASNTEKMADNANNNNANPTPNTNNDGDDDANQQPNKILGQPKKQNLLVQPTSAAAPELLKTRFSSLITAYHTQLTVGCGVEGCTTPNCASNPNFVRPADAFEEAKALARDGFQKGSNGSLAPVYRFCKHWNLPTQILHLDIPSLALLQARQNNKELFKATVREAFKSPENLAYAFLPEDVSLSEAWSSCDVDLDELEKVFKFLAAIPEIQETLSDAMTALANALQASAEKFTRVGELRPLVILFMWSPLKEYENHQSVAAKAFKATASLPTDMRTALQNCWSRFDRDRFEYIVMHVIQSFITLQIEILLDVGEPILHAVVVLSILNEANKRDAYALQETLIPYKEFYNDAINNMVNIETDYRNWRKMQEAAGNPENWNHFSFIAFPFIIDAATKAQVLLLRSKETQVREQRQAISRMILGGMSLEEFFLVLKIDRNDLIRSALNEINLKRAALKKPLRVMFVGEEGIDEGGVKKEFFQLTVKELFDPRWGMFTYNETSRLHWFSQQTLDTGSEYRLMGTVFGLAIYNGIILEIRFPLVVYKRMLGWPVGLKDLYQLDEALHHGFTTLLAFEENPEQGLTVEEIYDRNFTVEFEWFGEKRVHELVEGGENIKLTIENRQEYVDKYVEWVLITCVKDQFDAFLRGFHEVCGTEVLQMCRPEELELMVCGSPELDFHELEKTTLYDGYKANDAVIKNFWEVVHSLSEDEQCRLLKFSTGTDRVPVKGLKGLNFVIGKNGDDSDMLPTSHTCFNHLLLPAYNTKEKMKEKLLLAINNCTGFGLK